MKFFVILIFLFFSIFHVYADNYNKAIDYYKSGKYNIALNLFKDYAIDNSAHGNKQATSLLIMAKIYINLNEFRNADFVLKIYADKYSKLYKTDYLYLNGLLKIENGNYYSGLVQLFEVAKSSDNPYYNKKIISIIKDVTVDSMRINITQLQDFYKKTKMYPQINHVALFSLAKFFFLNKNYKTAKKYSENYLKNYRDYAYSNIVYNYLKVSETQKDNKNKIALLIPLTGDYAKYGKMILNSVKLYMKDHKKNDLVYQVFDTKGDAVETINQVKSILAYGDFKAIIGPVTSINVIAASAIVSQYDIPLITPTATEDGISKIGQNIFQINVSIKKLGEKIAKYSNDSLKLKNYIIVAPDNSYGRIQTESFTSYVESHGSRIVSTQYYKEGTQDFKNLMLTLRKTLLLEKIEKENFINGTNYSFSGLTKKQKEETDLKIDGIFIPSSDPNELIMLIPQLLYYRISGVLLGSSGWYSDRVIKNAGQYLNNSFFSLFFYKLDRYNKRVEFEKKYRSKFGNMPLKVSYLGYDAIDLINDAISSGYTKQVEISYYLKKLNNFEGVAGDINFLNTDGDNNDALIIKVNNGFFKKIN